VITMTNNQHSRPVALDPLVIAGNAEDVADQILLPQAPEASALPRPGQVDALWVEHEYDALGAEQRPLWEASAQEASRPSLQAAAGARLAADAAERLLGSHQMVVDAAQQRYLDTMAVLAAHRRRAEGTKVWYQLAKTGFLLGDLAGFASAALWLGEEIPIALALALSAAVATIAAGLVGVELRDVRGRRRRHRPADDLTGPERQFAHLFTGDDQGASLLKRIIQVSLATAGMIGIGIGALRATVDDPVVGLVFGGIALAVAGGSFLVSYAGADEIADLIDHAHKDYVEANAAHRQMATDPVWQRHAAAQVDADNAIAEHAHRADAAQHHVKALKWRILRQNPHIAGHGPGTPAVGRTSRREEDR